MNIIPIPHTNWNREKNVLSNPNVSKDFQRFILLVEIRICAEEIEYKQNGNDNRDNQYIGSVVNEFFQELTFPLEIQPNMIEVHDIQSKQQNI